MKTSRHLIKFKKESSVLLINAATIQSMLLNKGSDYVLNLLEDVDKIRDDKLIRKKYKQDGKLIDMLLAHDILVGDDDDEDYRVPERHHCAHGCKKAGMSVYLLLSQDCNLGCVYCLNGEKTYQKNKQLLMSEETAITTVDFMLRTLAPDADMEIVFFGGEPLMNWPVAKKVILHCENRLKESYPGVRVRYHLTTNLTLFPADLIEWAKRYNIGFLCDVDGDEELHNRLRPFKDGRGSQKVILKNIKRLRNEGIEVALRTTVTSHNADRIEEISKLHKEIGGSGSAFVSVNAVTSDESVLTKSLLPDPDTVAKGLRDLVSSRIWYEKQIFPLNEFLGRISPGVRNVWACGAPFGNTPVVDVRGDVFACIYLVGIKRYLLGNVFSGAEYPDKEIVSNMMRAINIDNDPQCEPCRLKYICGGGCPVGRFIIDGNPNADDDIVKYTRDIACSINKAMIEESLWYYAKKRIEDVGDIK